MRPDTGNPLALSPFRTPVPLPVQDPDGSPTTTLVIACSWLPLIRGALLAATMQYTWPQTDRAAVLLAQQRVMTLIAMLVECPDAIPPVACDYDFAVTDAGWELVPGFSQGFYSPGVGFVGTTGGPSDHGEIYIQHLMSSPRTVTSVSFSYQADDAGAGADNFVGVLIDSGSGPVIVQSGTLEGGDNLFTWTGSIDDVVGIYVATNSGTVSTVVNINFGRYTGLSEDGCG